jgi:hypothetical protein
MMATTRPPLAASYGTHLPTLPGMVNIWERRMR